MGNGELVHVNKSTGEMMSSESSPFAGMQIDEMNVASSMVSAYYEMLGGFMTARRFPRDEKACFAGLMESCKRKTLADKAIYSFPRGGTTVSGPSVNLARVAAQKWGHMRWGLSILKDDDEKITIEGWAYDMQTGNKVPFQDTFAKLIYRKSGGWIKPDERDLRELVMRRGAILIRNALLNVLPRDLIEDAMAQCRATMKQDIKDPKGEQKRLILAFGDFGVTTKMLDDYLGHDSWTPDDILDLQGVLLAIKEGASKIEDYFSLKREEVKPPAGLGDDDMAPGDVSKHQDIKGKGAKGAGELPLDQGGEKKPKKGF